MTPPPHPNEAVRILVADADDIVEAIAQAQSNGETYTVAKVLDGVQAMHTLLGEAFDIALIDLAMPSLDGLRLIALIRATPKLRRLPILAIAAPQEPATTTEGLKAGASDYLARPLDWPQLAMRIRQLVGDKA